MKEGRPSTRQLTGRSKPGSATVVTRTEPGAPPRARLATEGLTTPSNAGRSTVRVNVVDPAPNESSETLKV